MHYLLLQSLRVTLQSLLAVPSARNQQIEQHQNSLQEHVMTVVRCFGKDVPRAGRKQYLLTCLATITWDGIFLYATTGSVDRVHQLFAGWRKGGLPRMGWEAATLHLLETGTRLLRLLQVQDGTWQYTVCGAIEALLRATETCALLLESDLEQRLQRALAGFPSLPASMRWMGTGFLSWLYLHQDNGGQKRIILLEGSDGSLVPLSCPAAGAYGQVYALVCEEQPTSSVEGELQGVPYHQPLLLGEGCLTADLMISPLSHACWLLSPDGTVDPWDQAALHRVDYRYAHLLFLPVARSLSSGAASK